MASSRCCRQGPRAGTSVALLLGACAFFGCGGSGLRSSRSDAGRDAPSSGVGGGDVMTDTVDATGRAADAPGPAWDGGAGGQGGTVRATGGAAGRDGGLDLPANGGGGSVSTGGTLGTGGITSSSRPRTGGTTSTGGLPRTGGIPSTGGRSGSGGASAAGGTGGLIVRDGGIDGATGIAAALLQPLAKAFCAAARTCCLRDGFYAMALDDCEAELPNRLLPSVLVDQGIVTVDAARLAACVSAYERAATSCTSNEVEAACQGVWVGTRTEGQPCGGTIRFGAFDCSAANGSAACYWKDAARHPDTAGVCVALPRGKAGDPCSKSCKTGHDCIVDLVGGSAPLPVMCFEEDGLYCAVSANPPVCKPILQAGDPCPPDPGACGRAGYCDRPVEECQPAANLGEPCAGGDCAYGLRCASSRRCAEQSLVSSYVCQGTPPLP